ncbi:MAG TPA: tetratricopeptide repeat protein [Bryobacteraceae bacterium]|jgi:tetratricopeptide (TPR) repeat protein
MATLRIIHTGSYVHAILDSDQTRQIEKRLFSFSLSAQDAEDIRWYLEDYRIYPVDPAPIIADRIEQRMAEAGRELFRQVLAGSDVWASMRRNLSETRIEVETELDDALVPWELMRDPVADLPLALNVNSFIRCHSKPSLPPNSPEQSPGKIRILLVICRLEEDRVPFRSVARHLLRGLTDSAREPFELEVLRPPTFQQLGRRLREARAQRRPFNAVHFDGHGLAGRIYFENPELEGNAQAVNAAELGSLLHETSVPLLILNACRSADSEPPAQPQAAGDMHQQIRQFGSFAHAVMDYGASGVVAWRYSVFVDTAAQYMADLYAALASGLPLGESATMARKQLHSANRPIEDWTVPVVFEAAPVRLFPNAGETIEIKLTAPASGDSGLPHAPDIGFIGRDETILKLDRAFDDQDIVLVHAYAGGGKTSTAAEFARWYRQTGFAGPPLFTSFEEHKPLPRVLDDLGRFFEGLLAKSGIQWLTRTDAERRDVALQLLRQIPVLWIWDNVEPIHGFPAGSPSAWTAAEQAALLDFLQAARGTKARFLLTSRRDERDWLHELPARIPLPPMPFYECIEMTEQLAKKLGRRLDDVEDWRPLVHFTQGNPLTLSVLVGQALRDRLTTREQIANFVRNLQAGESVFEDEASEGRTRSLAASLAYGFENAFTQAERKQLALLHLFQGVANVDVLRSMGQPEAEWCVPEVKDLTREAGIGLLGRAAEIGLLTALGEGYYAIHPALPWFFRRLFDQYYSGRGVAAERAFVESMAGLAFFYSSEYQRGNHAVAGPIASEEMNLLHAGNLAQLHGWWSLFANTIQPLSHLYGQTGRRIEWARLVEEIVPYFVDPLTEGPLPGRETEWTAVTQYRVWLEREARRWERAEALQKLDVDWHRRDAAATLAKPAGTWGDGGKRIVRGLSVSLHELSEIQREQGSADCVKGYLESLALAESIADSQSAAVSAFNLGTAMKDLDGIRDLDAAEQWYRRSFELRAEADPLGAARCLAQTGTIAYLRARDANKAGRIEERLAQLALAEQYYERALELFPPNAVRDLAVTQNQLGNLYGALGRVEKALHHYQESIRLKEAMHDRYAAGISRRNAARPLADAGRFDDAIEWAQAALRDFEGCENAYQDVLKTRQLLERLESDRQAKSQPS